MLMPAKRLKIHSTPLRLRSGLSLAVLGFGWALNASRSVRLALLAQDFGSGLPLVSFGESLTPAKRFKLSKSVKDTIGQRRKPVNLDGHTNALPRSAEIVAEGTPKKQ